MKRAFFEASAMNQSIDSWQTNAVTTFESMFHNAVSYR